MKKFASILMAGGNASVHRRMQSVQQDPLKGEKK